MKIKYNFVTGPKTVTVITPTIGSAKLRDAIESVKAQTYQHINHLVVVDGPDYQSAVHNLLTLKELSDEIQLTTSPFNTGKVGDGFYGHRINTDYIFFLDGQLVCNRSC